MILVIVIFERSTETAGWEFFWGQSSRITRLLGTALDKNIRAVARPLIIWSVYRGVLSRNVQ